MSIIILLIMAVLMVPLLTVSAATKAEKDEVDQKIVQTKNDLKKGKEKQNELFQQVQDINGQMEAIQNEISELENQISGKQQEIEEAEAELESKKQEVGRQNHALDTRLRAMYKNGDTGMLQVLMGSADISELISNIEIVQKIYENDIQVLKDLKYQYEALAEQIQILTDLKQQLEQQQNEKQENEETLSEKMAELESLEKQVAKDNEALEAQLDELNKESEKITEELRKQELAVSSSSGSSYDGGSMLWPVPSYHRISSKYGYRFHPILHVNKMHMGLDISAASGEQILAASDGKVIYASVRGGYGNCVMIDHSGGIVTLYGHCSRLLVTQGQYVTRGQSIALVGSTGLSTGPHCHFEVRVNGATTDPLNHLDLTGIHVS